MLTHNRALGTLARGIQIVWILAAELFAYVLHQQPLSEHFYRAIVRLGPTFIKLGQIASTRPDLVPPEVSHRLKELQENVPAFPFEQARALIEAELGEPLTTAFRTFSNQPVAAASLSQVYFAELPDGPPVAVKVQRPGIRSVIVRDLAIMASLARLAERFSRVARDLRLRAAIDEFGRWTLKELDFQVEGHNAERFRRNFAGWKDVMFPRVYWTHTTARVLTMERVEGLRVGEVPSRLGPSAARRLAKRLAEMEMKMFISDAFFHADLHPGNIFFQPDGRIAVLDLGMVGRMTGAQRDRFLAYWIAITRRQRDRAFHHLIRMAQSTAGADLEGFRACYDISLERFYDKDLSERSLAQTYLDIVVSGARFGVIFPPEMILQAKAVVTAEALDLVLAPDFRFADEVRPIVARELAQRAAPGRLLDRIWGSLAEWVLLGEAAPVSEDSVKDEADEQAFRRLAKTSLADAWADSADNYLHRFEQEIPNITSADYWAERPQRHLLIQTMLEVARLAGAAFRRTQHEAALDVMPTSPFRSTSGNGYHGDAPPEQPNVPRADNKAVVGDEFTAAIGHLESLAAQYATPAFWKDRTEDIAALYSTVALLRFLVGQFAQSAHETWEA